MGQKREEIVDKGKSLDEWKDLNELCERIFFHFAERDIHQYGEEIPFVGLIDYFPALSSIIPDEKIVDRLADVMWQVRNIAFAFGYVIGNQFDIPIPEGQKDVATIRAMIKEKGLLPYLPRKRKTETRQ